MADLTKEEKAKLQQNESEDNTYRKQLDKYFSNKMPVHEIINVCSTPNILKILKSTAKKIVLNQNELKNSMANTKLSKNHTEGHKISKDEIYKLSSSIRKPIVVLKGNVRNINSVVLLTDLVNLNGENVIVPIALDRQNGKISNVSTMYGKKNLSNYLTANISDILAINIKKADMFADIGVQFPKSIHDTVVCYDDSIAYTLKNVKYPEKNLIEQANVSQKSEVISDLNFAEVFEPETSTNDAILHEKAEVFYDLSDMGTTANNIDYKKVFELYSESAKADDATALNNLGCCYINGEGTDRSIQKAIECFERAAALKNSLAVVNLGKCAAVGCGVAKDPERAFELYRQAANMGSPLAYRMLAECYLNGVGTNKDVSKAADCLRQAETVKNKPLSLEEKLLQAERKANAANENNKQQRKEKSQNVSKSI